MAPPTGSAVVSTGSTDGQLDRRGCRSWVPPFDLGMRGSRGTRNRGATHEVHADHAGHRRDDGGVPGRRLQRDPGDDGEVQRRADLRRRARRRGGSGRRRERHRRRRLLVAAAGGDRRTLRRDQGAVRWLLAPRRRLQGGGGRVGQAGAPGRTRDEDRDPSRADHRRVPAGQRIHPEGACVAGVDRPAVSPDAGPPAASTSRQAVEAVWRIESARIVGGLARYTGDFALAEDLAQEALAEALVSWPRDGVPRNPAGWLLTVGRRRAIDGFRRRSVLDERYAVLSRDLPEGGAVTGAAAPDPGGPDRDLLWDPDR